MAEAETCCASEAAGCDVCEVPAPDLQRTPRPTSNCPACGQKGKPVQGQTVKALLSVSLRGVRDVQYLFCRSQACPVVYYSVDGRQRYSVDQVRERVYQKEPAAANVFVCYCFRHTVGEVRSAAPAEQSSILADINTGIGADQCACDLRNPQGSCCLGNVRALMARLASAHPSAR
jgi:hypothetical protein